MKKWARFFVFAGLAAIVCAGWALWPHYVLHRFLRAACTADVDGANWWVDGTTLRVHRTLDGGAILQWRSSRHEEWGGYPYLLEDFGLLLRKYCKSQPRSWMDIVSGRLQFGEDESVMYGHIEVRRCAVTFQSDLEYLRSIDDEPVDR